jgi:predicted TIM-barrel fold metal-dependent hydrolase
MWRDDWLARQTEDVIDPDRSIVDAHHHLWRLDGRPTYLQPEFQADAASGHKVRASVYIDCGWGYHTDGPEHLRVIGETESVAAAARDQAALGGTDIAAIIPFADLTSPHLDEVLAAHDSAGEGRFRGIRQSLAFDPDPRIGRPPQRPDPDLMDRDEFRAGLARLASGGYTFETYIYHPQIPQLAALASAVPEATIILNHLGTPLSIGPYADRREEVLDELARSLTELAQRPNVILKLGGIGMPLMGFGLEKAEVPPSSEAVASLWQPTADTAIRAFGPSRVMAESNFPVDRGTMSYRTLWNAMKRLVSGLPEADQQEILAGTAERVYRI